ncbi:MAG: hypothetical protein NUV83_03435 [Candidatus Wolfebacteria bacterium]|nr:hypothetical protein [Candidatus Wolfebacteria bacterium]
MENNRVSTISVIISIIVVFSGILVGWYFYSKRQVPASQSQPSSQSSTTIPLTLTKNSIDNLIKAMSASPTATSTLSKTQLDKLSKSMSAPKTAKPVLNSDEQKKLIEAMSAK